MLMKDFSQLGYLVQNSRAGSAISERSGLLLLRCIEASGLQAGVIESSSWRKLVDRIIRFKMYSRYIIL